RFYVGRAIPHERYTVHETHLQPILPPHVLAVRVAAHLDDAGVEERLDIRRQLADGLQLTNNLRQRVEVLEVIAHCGNVVLHSVGRCRDIGIVGHTYTSSNFNSISPRCGRDSRRTTRYAVVSTTVSGVRTRPSSSISATCRAPRTCGVPSTARAMERAMPTSRTSPSIASNCSHVSGRVRSVHRRMGMHDKSGSLSCT